MPGPVCMLTMLAHLKVRCFGLLLMLIPNGWKLYVFVDHATSQTTIDKLRVIFVTHGLPEMLVSDNDTPFTS